MSSENAIGYEGSVASTVEQNEADADGADTSGRTKCPECSGRIVTAGCESHCAECGLVVATDYLDRAFSASAHGPTQRGGPVEWSVEPTTPLRVDRGLHTTFFLGSDGQGRPLSQAQKDTFGRLKRRHKRFQMASKRDIRLNEGLRDVQMIGGELALPRYVLEDAARWLKDASEARLPGGHMAWEALAGGAVLLAAHNADVPRESTEVAEYAKVPHERVCAAARKIRIELGLADEVAPARSGVVEAVVEAVEAVDADALDVAVRADIVWLGGHLLRLADAVPVGPGTSRVTVGAAAVYAANRLLGGRYVTQAMVADAASTIVDTSTTKVGPYSRELFDAYVERYGTDDPSAVLDRERRRLQVG